MLLNDKNKFANITEDVVLGLRQRYENLHPLLFLRSVEKAKDVSELFDILETIPPLPVVWSADQRRWITMTELLTFNKQV